MNANTIYIQVTIDRQVVKTSSLKSQKRGNIITFDEQPTEQLAEKISDRHEVSIRSPNNQNLQFSSLHVPKPGLESL